MQNSKAVSNPRFLLLLLLLKKEIESQFVRKTATFAHTVCANYANKENGPIVWINICFSEKFRLQTETA